MRFRAIWFYTILLSPLEACQNCAAVMEQLRNIAPLAKQYYTDFSNYEKVSEVLRDAGSPLRKIEALVEGYDAIIGYIEGLCYTLDKAAFFRLTPRRACKLPMVAQCLNDIEAAMSNILLLTSSCAPPLLPDPDLGGGNDFIDLVSSFRPSNAPRNASSNFEADSSSNSSANSLGTACQTAWQNSIGELCDALSADKQISYENKGLFFTAQYYFYESLCLYFAIISNIFTKLSNNASAGLCAVCKNNAPQLAEVFRAISKDFHFENNLFLEKIKELEEGKTHQKQEKMRQIVDFYKEIPLKTQSGRFVGFIPEDQDYNVFVLEEDGRFHFHAPKSLWSPQEMAYITVGTNIPVEVDQLTGLITSPLQFFGKQAPVVSYITFEDLYTGIMSNTEKSASIIKKIHKQLKQY
jgi:hypothetical protein